MTPYQFQPGNIALNSRKNHAPVCDAQMRRANTDLKCKSIFSRRIWVCCTSLAFRILSGACDRFNVLLKRNNESNRSRLFLVISSMSNYDLRRKFSIWEKGKLLFFNLLEVCEMENWSWYNS